MRVFRIMGMGLLGLLGHPFRTGLAALGIVIGVWAVVTLTSLGNGIQASVSGQITDLGPNLITVAPGGGSGPDGDQGPFGAAATSTLTPEDTDRVADLPSIKAASSNVSISGLVDGESVAFSGVDPAYREIRSVSLASGRFVEGEGEVVLTTSDARDLLDADPDEAVGKTVTVRGAGGEAPERTDGGSDERAASQQREGEAPQGVPENLPEGISAEQAEALASQSQQGSEEQGSEEEEPPPPPQRELEVVGVVKSEAAGFGPPLPESSYITTEDALKLSDSDRVGQILASAVDAESVGEAKDGIVAGIKEAHGGQEDFSVVTQEELLSTFTEITDQLNVFLVGIAGISLLVGGIGIMNIMLVSVAERTREIGVRKALGATDLDILLQFLFEAVMLALLGGAAGVGLGIAASEILPVLLADLPPAVFGFTQIALAFGVSALIGVLFGSLPAYRSARLAPVEALRRE
jgi:putative ABC transport system permease protein